MLLIGGTATDRQIDKLKAKPHVVVGSPGRIVELIERGKLKMAHIRAVVIDEADRLLNDESLNWIQKIVSAAAPARQLIFASATIDQQTRQVLETLAPDVVMLRAGAAAVNENIEHQYRAQKKEPGSGRARFDEPLAKHRIVERIVASDTRRLG